MRSNRSRDTGPELRLRRELHRLGVRYRLGRRVMLADLTVRPDIVFVGRKIAVFVDGCFWHGCPAHGRMPSDPTGYWNAKIDRNRRRDVRVGEALQSAGWTVIRVWEHAAVVETAQSIAQIVRSAGGRPGQRTKASVQS
jgi:DNA mismatch endonuclease (patch repair protein)